MCIVHQSPVVLATVDSNVWGGASGHTYTFTRQPNGTTDIDLVVVREGKNFKGRVLGLVLRTIGRRVLERAFENSVKAIEAQNGKVENYEAELPRIRELRSAPTQCACALTNDAQRSSSR